MTKLEWCKANAPEALKGLPDNDVLKYMSDAWRNLVKDKIMNGRHIILYHGSPIERFTPKYGGGKDTHDYGRGFYLTPIRELAMEWSLCGTGDRGYLHTYELYVSYLSLFKFGDVNVLAWLAKLMKHRDAATSKQYRVRAPEFIKRYSIDIEGYDVICGWRADASYFSIAKEFVRGNLDYELIEPLFKLGGLNVQFCLKSELAFECLVEKEVPEEVNPIYRKKYNERDNLARKAMRELMESDKKYYIT